MIAPPAGFGGGISPVITSSVSVWKIPVADCVRDDVLAAFDVVVEDDVAVAFVVLVVVVLVV